MDRDSILAMEAGPEFDALVAERRMGWKLTGDAVIPYDDMQEDIISTATPERHRLWSGGKRKGDWSPSTDIGAAMEVADSLVVRSGDEFELEAMTNYTRAVFERNGHESEATVYADEADGFSAMAALAISQAALLTTLQTIPQEEPSP